MRFSDTSDFRPDYLHDLVLLATGDAEQARRAKSDQVMRQLLRRAGVE